MPEGAGFWRGVELFNAGYYWECHEEWEALWRGSGPRTPTGRLLRALIQAAAAALKHELGSSAAAASLARKALRGLARDTDPRLGVDLPRFARDLRAWLEGRRRAPPRLQPLG